MDHTGKVDITMKTSLDQNGNATHYYLDSDKPISPQSIRIQNFYDEKNLLIERLFFYTKEDVGREALLKLERYFYSSDPLTCKMKEGALLNREEGGAEDAGGE